MKSFHLQSHLDEIHATYPEAKHRPLIGITANYANPLQLILKRIIDIIGGILGSIVALILIASIGPKIKKESPGPILFKQVRIGKNGKRFRCYKIRSMYMDAEERKKELIRKR